MIDYVTIERFAQEVGLSKEAVQKAKTDWPEGVVWIKLGERVFFSISGWNSWAGQVAASRRSQNRASKSSSNMKANDAVSASSASPLPPTLDA